MNRNALILEFTKVLIWPFMAILMVIIFHSPIVSLISRLETASVGPLNVKFGDNLEEAKIYYDKLEKIPLKVGLVKSSRKILTKVNHRLLDLGLQPSPTGLDLNYYKKLATDDPNLALSGLAIEMDLMIRNLAKGSKLQIKDNPDTLGIIDQLREDSDISEDQLILAKYIIKLCIMAIHGYNIDKKETMEIIGYSDRLRDDFIDWLSWGFNDNWKPGS